jgi:hypothetical protein
LPKSDFVCFCLFDPVHSLNLRHLTSFSCAQPAAGLGRVRVSAPVEAAGQSWVLLPLVSPRHPGRFCSPRVGCASSWLLSLVFLVLPIGRAHRAPSQVPLGFFIPALPFSLLPRSGHFFGDYSFLPAFNPSVLGTLVTLFPFLPPVLHPGRSSRKGWNFCG